MDKPKILVCGDTPTVSTGFGVVNKNIFKYLYDEWDVHILGVNYFGDPHDLNCKIYPAYTTHDDHFGLTRYIPIIDTIEPDVVFVLNDPWIVSDFIDHHNTLTNNRPALVCYMPVDAKNIKSNWTGKFHFIDSVVFYTEFGAEESQKSGYFGDYEVIPHGVDTDLFHPFYNTKYARQKAGLYNIIGDRFLIGNINRNSSRKRLDLSIKYFSEWVRRYDLDDPILYLHTRTKDYGFDLPQLAKYYGVQDRVILPDFGSQMACSFQQMQFIYNSLDLHISTTQGEGWGLSQHEAMACAIPNLVPEWSALGEWPKGAVEYVPCTSISTTPGENQINTIGGVPDEEQFIEKLNMLYSDPERRSYLSKKSFELATQDKFNWKNISNKFNEIFKQYI